MSKIKTLFVLAFAVMGVLVSSHKEAQADVVWVEKEQALIISGGVNSVQTLKVFYALKNNPVKMIYLSGPGGSMKQMFLQGMYIERANVPVIIPSGETCVSACALIAMSAKTIKLDGEMWYHRPYATAWRPHVRLDDIMGEGQSSAVELAKYFIENKWKLGLLLQIMRSTNPCEYLVVNNQEDLEKLRGGPLDPSPYVFEKGNKCGYFEDGSRESYGEM